jgi:citrate synthase
MKALAAAAAHMKETGVGAAEAAAWLLAAVKEKGKRLAGFGHRFHTADPRTARLLALADELGLAGEGVALARALEAALAANGKPLPLNVDGAIAACLYDLGFEPAVANAFFIMARLPGWLAHIREEWAREKPMRRLEPSAWVYDGPAERRLK